MFLSRACSACVLALALCLASAPATSWDAIPIPPDTVILFPPPASAPGHPKMDGALSIVADVAATESDEAALLRAARLGVPTHEGRVQVHLVIEPDDADAVVEAVEVAGGIVTKSSTDGSLLQAWLPPGALLAIADEMVVLYVRVPNLAVAAASEPSTVEEDLACRADIVVPEPSWTLLALASVATCAGLARRRARGFARR